MAVENVVCPNYGESTFATILFGQRLVQVINWKRHKRYNNTDLKQCKCKHCKSTFYTETVDIDK